MAKKQSWKNGNCVVEGSGVVVEGSGVVVEGSGVVVSAVVKNEGVDVIKAAGFVVSKFVVSSDANIKIINKMHLMCQKKAQEN